MSTVSSRHITRAPELDRTWGIPVWHHHHGIKMKHTKTEDSVIYIGGSAAFVEIHPFENERWESYKWNVKWRVQFSLFEEASGNCLFSNEQLECAFRLRDKFTQEQNIAHSNWMVKDFGGALAAQGRFIRWEDHLTLPAPGMGHDGVAAVSILLDYPIKEAVQAEVIRRFPDRVTQLL